MAESNRRIESVERIYAQALLEMAQGANALDDVADEVAQLRAMLDESADLARLLASQILTIEERAGSLEQIFKGRVHDLVYRFLLVVNDKQRTAQLGDILDAFKLLLDQKRDLIEVDAFVAEELLEGDADEVATAVGAAIGKHVTLRQHVQPHLLGGLKLRIGDQLLDGSVLAQLKIIKRRLIERGREAAQGAEI